VASDPTLNCFSSEGYGKAFDGHLSAVFDFHPVAHTDPVAHTNVGYGAKTAWDIILTAPKDT
jgi:hypothetical protein